MFAMFLFLVLKVECSVTHEGVDDHRINMIIENKNLLFVLKCLCVHMSNYSDDNETITTKIIKLMGKQYAK